MMRRLFGFALAALSLVGCDEGDGDADVEEEEGMPSQAICPGGSGVTYEADIKPMMEQYCTSCHASTLSDGQRRGAPVDHNFDTQDGLLKDAYHVDREAAAGPTVVNTHMPPAGNPAPTVEARKKLGEWLACYGDLTAQEHGHDGGDH